MDNFDKNHNLLGDRSELEVLSDDFLHRGNVLPGAQVPRRYSSDQDGKILTDKNRRTRSNVRSQDHIKSPAMQDSQVIIMQQNSVEDKAEKVDLSIKNRFVL